MTLVGRAALAEDSQHQERKASIPGIKKPEGYAQINNHKFIAVLGMRHGISPSPLRSARGDSLIFFVTLRSGSTDSGLRAYAMGPYAEGLYGVSDTLCAMP